MVTTAETERRARSEDRDAPVVGSTDDDLLVVTDPPRPAAIIAVVATIAAIAPFVAVIAIRAVAAGFLPKAFDAIPDGKSLALFLELFLDRDGVSLNRHHGLTLC